MKNNKGTILEKCEVIKQEDGTYKFIEHTKMAIMKCYLVMFLTSILEKQI
ncbi:TPA: hypothetical protein ACSRER_001359 [Clostridioides difficile]